MTASRIPASAGPAKKPTLSIVEAATFAADSSAGPAASSGSRDACAERNGEPQIAARIASAYTPSGAPPPAISAAAAKTRMARVRSDPTMTSRRG